MGDKVPFETYNLICRDLDNANEKTKQLNDNLDKTCEVIDTFITLFFLRQDKMDYNVVSDGLNLIKERLKENKSFRITVALKNYLDKY